MHTISCMYRAGSKSESPRVVPEEQNTNKTKLLKKKKRNEKRDTNEFGVPFQTWRDLQGTLDMVQPHAISSSVKIRQPREVAHGCLNLGVRLDNLVMRSVLSGLLQRTEHGIGR
eukprot:m.169051 g.169051  ORF g.169051 m.169051 type:complete len:114 (-) comp21178_c0_seq2:391-732(-)